MEKVDHIVNEMFENVTVACFGCGMGKYFCSGGTAWGALDEDVWGALHDRQNRNKLMGGVENEDRIE